MRRIEIRVSGKRVVICILLLVISCAFFISRSLWQHALVIGTMFVILIPSSVRADSKIISLVIDILWFILCTVTTFLIVQLSINASIHAVGVYRICINLLIIAAFSLILNIFIGRIYISTIIIALFFMLYSTIDFYILQFRGREVTPFDILSAQTAANVAAKFDFTPGLPLLGGILIFIQLIILSIGFPGMKKSGGMSGRGISLVLAILCVVCSFNGSRNCTAKHFGTSGAGINGSVLNFLLQLDSLKIDPPEGYSNDAVSIIAQQTQVSQEAVTGNNHIPDIIVIMDESFADLSVLGSEPRTNMEVTPFIDSLDENTVRGYALSSVFGGDTANSEYEFLTGNSLYFLPENTVPYQQYIKDETGSIVSYLKKQGYSTLAMHPFEASGWMRTQVYPLLGFDRFIFMDDFPQEDYVREYISDSEMFFELERQYEQITNSGDPAFIFGVTMQNHGGYSYVGNDFEIEITLEGYQSHYSDAEQYLTLLHRTDSAVQQLIEYFSAVEREVAVVFFGDHLPNLSSAFYKELHAGTFDSFNEEMLEYKIPFFIWTNYDIVEQDISCTSINYLSAIMFQSCEMNVPNYQRFLLNVSKSVPAINAKGFYKQQLKDFVSKEQNAEKRTNDSDNDELAQYAIIQYNNMFEKKENRNLYFSQ